MASVFKRGRTFWIRYTLNGKQHRESICTRSEKVAKMKLREYEVELDKGTLQSPSKTFHEIFLIEYFKHLKGIRPKKSWVNEKNRLECFFKLTGVTKLEQLTAATIAGHLERLAAKSPTGAWRPATYNRYREALVALFGYAIERFAYEPRRPDHFHVDRIYLAKGSLTTPERACFVERICALYPDAKRIERLDTPHNRIDLGAADPLARHRLGKRTLVFGEHRSAVRKSDEVRRRPWPVNSPPQQGQSRDAEFRTCANLAM